MKNIRCHDNCIDYVMSSCCWNKMCSKSEPSDTWQSAKPVENEIEEKTEKSMRINWYCVYAYRIAHIICVIFYWIIITLSVTTKGSLCTTIFSHFMCAATFPHFFFCFSPCVRPNVPPHNNVYYAIIILSTTINLNPRMCVWERDAHKIAQHCCLSALKASIQKRMKTVSITADAECTERILEATNQDKSARIHSHMHRLLYICFQESHRRKTQSTLPC